LTNRKERRAAKKLAKKSKLVMFSVSAPVLKNHMCIKTTEEAYAAVKWIDPDAAKAYQSLDQRILMGDKDIIRAIYYPDRVLGLKETPELFTCALAESVNLWSQRLTPQQLPYFDRAGWHHLEITQIEDDAVQWYWTLNRNNKISIQTEIASLHGLSNLDMRAGAQPGEFSIWTSIGNPSPEPSVN
jgi:hypothetical protein